VSAVTILNVLLLICVLVGSRADAVQLEHPHPLSYSVSYSGGTHVEVRLELPDTPAPRVLIVPRSIPMGYGEQPYDRFIDRVRAFSPEGEELTVERVEGPRWTVGDPGSEIHHIEYEVDLDQMESEILSAADTSKHRPGYVSLLGYSVFAYVEGMEELPIALSCRFPDDWPVVTTLAPQQPPSRGRTTATARDFYALADSQIVGGPELSMQSLGGPVPLFLALYTEGDVDAEIVGRLARQSMADVIRNFGSAPFPHYTIQLELLRPVSDRHEYGFSMEHLESATFYLETGRGVTASSTPQELERTRYNFAHHFAHAWIPKRSYGEGYYPFNWELAPLLDTIWLSEGFAQYAAIIAIADGLPEVEGARYRERLLEGRFRESLEQAPLFIKRMTTLELSRVASTRYSSDFRTGRNVFSRGGLMAAEMDELFRAQSGGKTSLRDALRHLVSWSEQNRRAFRIDELPGIFQGGTGVDVSAVMEDWLKAPVSGR
jgi:predicted metalloprotease with PDZ domain